MSTDTAWTRAICTSTRAPPVTLDSRLVDTPKWAGSLGVNAQAWSGEPGRVSLQADVSYRSSAFKDAINSPALR